MLRVLPVLLFAGGLAACATPHGGGPRSPTACDELPAGASALLKTGTTVIAGELHGTREIPVMVSALACAAAADRFSTATRGCEQLRARWTSSACNDSRRS